MQTQHDSPYLTALSGLVVKAGLGLLQLIVGLYGRLVPPDKQRTDHETFHATLCRCVGDVGGCC